MRFLILFGQDIQITVRENPKDPAQARVMVA